MESIPLTKWYNNRLNLLLVLLILVLSFCVYLPALSDKKQFTNWDDPEYVLNQPLIKSLSVDSIKEIFKPSRAVSANYHPVTMLSLAVNFHFSGYSPFGYYLTNIILHVLNTFLVFLFICLLSSGNFLIGAISALLFGIHPMHVESVAWLAERKDVLYAFFFFLSCITYLYYLDTGKRKFIWIALLFFILSCLSKAMAVVLPLVLLLIDQYRQRKLSKWTIAEKLPFFLVALLFGIAALSIQSKLAMNESNTFGFFQKIMFASYGLCMYVEKFFLPTHLSGFYPYPDLDHFPMIFYFVPLIAVLLFVIPYFLLRKTEHLKRAYVFGISFFIIALLPVLQLIAVGGAIMADRYSYISYTGLIFIVAIASEKYLLSKEWRMAAGGSVLMVAGALVFLSYQRVEVWNNSELFWTDVIKKSDQYIEVAYIDRGHYYVETGKHEKAKKDFEQLEKLNSPDAGVYVDLGNEYAYEQDYEGAVQRYTKAIALDPAGRLAYMNRAGAYLLLGKYKEAIIDLDRLLLVNDKYTERARQYKQKAEEELAKSK